MDKDDRSIVEIMMWSDVDWDEVEVDHGGLSLLEAWGMIIGVMVVGTLIGFALIKSLIWLGV